MRFDEYVKPAISHLGSQDGWRDLFWLIEEREGLIITLIDSSARQLRTELDNLARIIHERRKALVFRDRCEVGAGGAGGWA
jgi:hypothetical protein